MLEPGRVGLEPGQVAAELGGRVLDAEPRSRRGPRRHPASSGANAVTPATSWAALAVSSRAPWPSAGLRSSAAAPAAAASSSRWRSRSRSARSVSGSPDGGSELVDPRDEILEVEPAPGGVGGLAPRRLEGGLRAARRARHASAISAASSAVPACASNSSSWRAGRASLRASCWDDISMSRSPMASRSARAQPRPQTNALLRPFAVSRRATTSASSPSGRRPATAASAGSSKSSAACRTRPRHTSRRRAARPCRPPAGLR